MRPSEDGNNKGQECPQHYTKKAPNPFSMPIGSGSCIHDFSLCLRNQHIVVRGCMHFVAGKAV